MAIRNENVLPNGTVLRHGRDEYRIERFLGAGGFGITYLVSGKVSVGGNEVNVKYCVKEHFFSKDCWRDQATHAVSWSKPAEERVTEGKKDFIAEAKRLKDKIQHSHIVRVKDVFEANSTAYYVMEFLDGRSLRSYITKKGACKEEEAVALLLPVMRAIGYLHDQKITHLDIKPDNIMIVETNGKLRPVLIDFGLSKHYDKKGRATSTVRVQATSDGYSPIEQYQGIDTFQPTADIYALAATFVFCVTGSDPKKSADIRPGELRDQLEGLLTPATLMAVLNGMKPSQYERTQNVRSFLSELCPQVDCDNWDVENDNNITDPIFFKKKKSSDSFLTRIKNVFRRKGDEIKGGGVVQRKLDVPDVCIAVSLKYPKGMGLSKEVWLCQTQSSTVYTYDGETELDNEDFFGGIHKEIRTYLMDSGLLEAEHWENETHTSEDSSKGSVSITFHYSDGSKYIRSLDDISTSHRLFRAVKGLLEHPSIIDIIYNYDRQHQYEQSEKTIPTEPIFLKSTMLAYHKGMLYSINLNEWRSLSSSEKQTFEPFIISLLIENNSISMFAWEMPNLHYMEVKSALENYEKQLCPSGISEYDSGTCRLLTSEEFYLLEDNALKVKNTFEEWGLSMMNPNQWVSDNNRVMIRPISTGPERETASLRPFVDFYGTIVPYIPQK